MMIKYGEEELKKFLKGFISNFARKPSGGDRDQIRISVDLVLKDNLSAENLVSELKKIDSISDITLIASKSDIDY